MQERAASISIFIFISERHPMFYHRRVRVDARNIPTNFITIDDAFMRQELEQQARGRISVHFSDLYEKTQSNMYLQRLELEDGEPADIIGLWLRGAFHDEIRRVKNTTQSDSLKEFLAVVVDLPPFKFIS